MKTDTYFPWRPINYAFVITSKEEWIPVRKPERFLYHLTLRGANCDAHDRFMCRLNYAIEGLRGREWGYGGVWANHRMGNIHCLWPVAFDSWDEDSSRAVLALLKRYDVWRIDTRLVGNEWFIDPNMMNEQLGYGRASDYLFTENTVHPRALKLFQFYIDEYAYLNINPASAKYSLVAVREVNEFIHYKWWGRRRRIWIGRD